MLITRILFIAVTMALASGSAFAEIYVKDYERLKNDKSFQIYINGVGRGIIWADVFHIRQNSKPMFCIPEKLSLTGDNFISIIDNELKEHNKLYKPDSAVEMVLFYGFINTFPCTSSS